MQELKQPSKKPLIFYYIVTLLIVMVLNMTLFPTVLQQRVQDVTYDQFMSMTYDKNVGQVEIEDTKISEALEELEDMDPEEIIEQFTGSMMNSFFYGF